MSMRFMPEASLASMEQYRPTSRDVTKELTRDTRSHDAYASGSLRAMREICLSMIYQGVESTNRDFLLGTEAGLSGEEFRVPLRHY